MLINYKIVRNKLTDIVADWALPRPTNEERARIRELRDGIRALPSLEKSSSIISEQEWNNNRIKLRRNILARDPRNFLRWPVVLFTMFHDARVEEVDYLKTLSSWRAYEAAVNEVPIGHPKPYSALPSSSGNLVHHAYSLAILAETFSVRIDECKNIFEFGGGYGSFTRLVYQLGFTGAYTIFDLPEFSLLQKYYLSSIPELSLHFGTNTSQPKMVILATTLSQVSGTVAKNPIDIFVALWSLSESPLDLREQIFTSISQPRLFLIAYQERFNTIDNRTYFRNFVTARSDYSWVDFPIKHLPRHRYLLGKKNEQ